MGKEKDFNELHQEKIENLFPPIIGAKNTAYFFEHGLEILKSISHNSSSPWVPYSPSD
ncbi:MAG: hypothetical protein Q8P01_01625 [bacterium]|nr:hypothetical protein [bacterium]